MKKLFDFRVLTVLVLLSLVSCEKSLEPIGVLNDESLNVGEAKAWFEGFSKNARMEGEEVYSQVYWKYAFETKADKERKQSVVIVPISHGRKGRAYGYKQLWVYKGKDKKNTMRVVEFVYDKDIPRKDLGKYSFRNFTGAMVVRNWDDEIISGFRYRDGKPIAALRLDEVTVKGKKQPLDSKKNGRTASSLGCGVTSVTYTSGWYFLYNGEELFRYEQTYVMYEVQCFYDNTFDMSGSFPGESTGFTDQGGGGGNDGYSSGPGDSYFKKFSVHDDPCEGFKQALAAQDEDKRETMGLLTTDGKFIITPNESNDRHGYKFTFGVRYLDSQGRTIIVVDEINGVWNAMLYYYDGDNPQASRYEDHNVKGIVHTHPIESGYNENVPSPEDYLNAAAHQALSHYVIHDNAVFKFNTSGETNRMNNWKNNCDGVNSFLN